MPASPAVVAASPAEIPPASPSPSETPAPAGSKVDAPAEGQDSDAAASGGDAVPALSDAAARELLMKARYLAAYLAEHPAPIPEADLAALDTAISALEEASAPAARTVAAHRLQAAYRKVATASFAATGVTGTTLEDSAAGAPLLWTVPFTLTLLIFIFFPALLLLRTLAEEMFTLDFANDVIWSIGAMAGFLWGAVGALTQIALNIALAVFRRRFDGGIRQSPFLRAGLGGMTGALVFLGLEFVLPMSSAAAEFMLDMAAFAGGLLSTLSFALLQSVISFLDGLLSPKEPSPAVTKSAKK